MVAAVAVTFVLVTSCSGGGGVGSAASGSATLSPPEWIQGYWRCRGNDLTHCSTLGFWAQVVFLDDEIRIGTPESNTRYAPERRNATQTVTSDTYTITERPSASLTHTYTWRRISADLLVFTEKYTGDVVQTIGPAHFVRG